MMAKSSGAEAVNWQAQADQYLVQEQYEQAASLYEQAIIADPEIKSNYWHLGLLLLLQGQEAEAWTTWLVGIGEGEQKDLDSWTSELIQVLEAEAERRQELADYQVAWTIRQYIRELHPNQINNLLQLIQLSIYLGSLTGEELNSLEVIQLLRSEQKVEINSDLLLQVLRNLLTFFPFEPLTLEFAEAHFYLAKNLVIQGKLSEALESIDRVITLASEWSVARTFKASIIKSTFEIRSPLEHNSKENVDEWYSNPLFWQADLLPETLKFYDDIIQVGNQYGIAYDDKHIVDVGCGTGYLLLSLYRHFSPSSLTGFDFSPAALKVASEVIPNATLYEFDIYQGTDLKFDVVFYTDTLEHFLYPDQALRNLVAMLNESGSAIVTVPNGRNDIFVGHINFWSPQSWQVFVKSVCKEFEVETGLDTHDHILCNY